MELNIKKLKEVFIEDKPVHKKKFAVFTHVSQFGRIKETFETIFLEIRQTLFSLFFSLSLGVPSKHMLMNF